MMNRNDNLGFNTIFAFLESEDLHTRLGSIKIINCLLKNQQTKQGKQDLITFFNANNVPIILQVRFFHSMTTSHLPLHPHSFQIFLFYAIN